MKNRFLVAMPCFMLAACASAQATELRPGLWEFMSKSDMPGMSAQMARMQEQMKNMPPEARRMIEQQMAAQGVAMGGGGAVRVCITAESAKRGDVYSGRTDGDCRYTDVVDTASQVTGRIACTKPKASGDFEARIDSPVHFRSTVHMKSADGEMKVDTDARWIEPDCSKIQPSAR